MVPPAELQTIELCSGYGGFSLGLKLAGVEHRTVAHVERDSHAAAVLVARMEDETLDQAPIWSDLVTFDGGPWRGRVDLITAGFPCQPWSAAGQKRGTDDDRWLWPHITRIIAEVGPSLVFLENVPGLNRGADGGGLSFVLQDLADLGFDAEWGLLAAAAVGASQRRERLWILAVAHGNLDRLQAVWASSWQRADQTHDADGPSREAVGDASSAGRPEVAGGPPGDEAADGWWAQGADQPHCADQDVGEPQGPGLEKLGFTGQSQLPGSSVPGNPDVADATGVGWGRPGIRSAAQERPSRITDLQAVCNRMGWPPRPDDADGWERWIAAGGPEPSLRRVPDGATGRLVKPAGITDRLHLLGNGLVPLCAAHAFSQLSARFLASTSEDQHAAQPG